MADPLLTVVASSSTVRTRTVTLTKEEIVALICRLVGFDSINVVTDGSPFGRMTLTETITDESTENVDVPAPAP